MPPDWRHLGTSLVGVGFVDTGALRYDHVWHLTKHHESVSVVVQDRQFLVGRWHAAKLCWFGTVLGHVFHQVSNSGVILKTTHESTVLGYFTFASACVSIVRDRTDHLLPNDCTSIDNHVTSRASIGGLCCCRRLLCRTTVSVTQESNITFVSKTNIRRSITANVA